MSTRLDDAKYVAFADSLSAEIKGHIPSATILFNKVPKEWAMSDIYCQLIPNDDEDMDYYDIMPRPWAFEVSTVLKDGGPILFYSKIMAKMWPHYVGVGKKIGSYHNDLGEAKDKAAKGELVKKYYFTGASR